MTTGKITPADYGAIGDNSTDDTTALNAMFADLRNNHILTSGGTNYADVLADGQGLMYKANGYVDATHLSGRNIAVRDLFIHSFATGKIALDFSGGAQLDLDHVGVWGDASAPPDLGMWFGRVQTEVNPLPPPHTSADRHSLGDIDCWGTFKKAAFGNLASEEMNIRTLRSHNDYYASSACCSIFAGNSAVFTGNPGIPYSDALHAVSPTAEAIGTGSQSLGNTQIALHDARRPYAYAYAITGFTKSATPTVTIAAADAAAGAASFGLGNGARIYLLSMNGTGSGAGTWGSLTGRLGTVSSFNAAAGTFVVDIDTSAISDTFQSGSVCNNTGAAVVIGEVSSFKQANGYVLTYSDYKYLIDPTASYSRDWVIEIAGRHEMQGPNLVGIKGDSSNTQIIRQLRIQDDNSNSMRAPIIGVGVSGTGLIRIENLELHLAHQSQASSIGIFDNPAYFQVRGGRVSIDAAAMITGGQLASLNEATFDVIVPNASDTISMVHSGARRFADMPLFPKNTFPAAGTTQATATQLEYGFNRVTGADGTKGVKLPNHSATAGGEMVWIKNDANAILKVYPYTSDVINALAANAAFSMPAFTSIMLWGLDGVTWYTVPLVAS